MYRIISRRRLAVPVAIAIVSAGVAVGITAYARAGTGRVAGQLAPTLGSVPLIQGTESSVLATSASRLPLVSNPATVEETVPAAPDSGPSASAVSGLEVTCDLAVASIHDA